MKKISIIVPIFNIGSYISKCIDSIINQTYRDLEIILVDDGSTDDSGKICDEYAKKEKRIKVIHKENGGLSDARNIGIKNATGDYLSFIDGDDWIEHDLYEVLFRENKDIDADIITFGMSIDYDDGKVKIKNPIKKELLNNMDALIYLNTYKNIDVSACNKIFKKELFDNVKFIKGKLCEDYYIMYRLFDKANQILTVPLAKYHYFQRRNSLSKNSKVNMDYLYASEEQMKYISKNYPYLDYIGKTNYAFANITIYNAKVARGLLKSTEQRINIVKNTKIYFKDVMKNRYLSGKKKIQFLVFINMNYIYYLLINYKYQSQYSK